MRFAVALPACVAPLRGRSRGIASVLAPAHQVRHDAGRDRAVASPSSRHSSCRHGSACPASVRISMDCPLGYYRGHDKRCAGCVPPRTSRAPTDGIPGRQGYQWWHDPRLTQPAARDGAHAGLPQVRAGSSRSPAGREKATPPGRPPSARRGPCQFTGTAPSRGPARRRPAQPGTARPPLSRSAFVPVKAVASNSRWCLPRTPKVHGARSRTKAAKRRLEASRSRTGRFGSPAAALSL